MTIKELLNKARRLNACDKVNGIRTYEGLINLYFSPYGKEFCESNNFPCLEDLKLLKRKLEPYDIYVDSGDIETESHKVAFIGKTHGVVTAVGTQAIFNVVVQHGGSVTINASDYAVVNVTNINGGDIIINADKTVVVL